VLLSEGHENFRYFGTIRLEDYKAGSRRLKKVIEALTRGHRVEHDADLWTELEELEKRMFRIPFRSESTPIASISHRKKCRDCSAADDYAGCLSK